MKQLSLTTFLSLLALLATAQLVVESAEPIATNDWGNIGPKIAVLGDGSPVAFWGRNGFAGGELLVSRKLSGGWESPQVIAVDAGVFVNAFEGPQLAAHGDKIYISFSYSSLPGAYIVRSLDGGANWELPVRVDSLSHNPVLVGVNTNKDGQPVFTYLNNEGAGVYTYRVARSTDFGASWNGGAIANANMPGSAICECCPATIIATGDTVFLQMRNNNGDIRDIWVARSTDAGDNFPDATDIDPTDWFIAGCPASGPNGVLGTSELVSVFMSGASSPSQVHYGILDRNDMSFGGSAPINTDLDWSQNLPRLAGKDNELVAVWPEAKAGSKRIRLAWTQAGATALSDNVISLGDSTDFPAFPDISWDGNFFHIVYAAAGRVYYHRASFNATGLSASNEVKVQIYPNPSSGNIQIDWPEWPAVVEVWSTTGQLVYKAEMENAQLSLSQLPEGSYLLQLQSAHHNGQASLKIGGKK